MFKITNHNEDLRTFVGRYDGHDYAFPWREPVYCPPDAARHIFGIGEHDKAPILARHGWATFSGGFEAGMKILNGFKFEHIQQVLDAPLALVDHGPAPVVQNAPGDAGGTDGSAAPPEAVAIPAVTGPKQPAPLSAEAEARRVKAA